MPDQVLAARDRLLVLLDSAYEVAADPASFDKLLDASNSYFFSGIESLAADIPRVMAEDPFLRPHVDRIARQLDALPGDRTTGSRPAAYARMLLAKGGVVLTANAAATALTGVTAPSAVSQLPFDHESLRAIDKALRGLGARSAGPAGPVLLNITLERDGAGCIGLLARARLEQPDGSHAEALALSLSHIDWTAKQDAFMEPPFSLTRSESEVLAGLMEGLSYDEIAEARGRLVSTVRSQIKAIMRKTGRNKIAALVQLGASVGYLTELSNAIGEAGDAQAGPSHVSRVVANLVTETQINRQLQLDLHDGRRLGYYLHGPECGKPALFFHGLILGPTITPSMNAALFRHGLRLIAPSRPHFGLSSPPLPQAGFDDTVLSDAAALVEHLGIEDLVIVAHQGGVSHAFRVAGRFANRLHGMVMVGAGIPIDESRHLRSMNPQTRLAAAATRHAPVLMELITRAAIAVFNKRGHERFLYEHFAENPGQLASLRDPEVMAVSLDGLGHLIAQGAKAFVVDGGAAMANWSDDFIRITAPCHWIHGTDDAVLKPDDIREWVSAYPNHTLDVIGDGTSSLLYTHAEDILAEVALRFR
ncbi:pimeloyl-ACP methyl ester carboxylesterase [Hoeflea marina]|uniref:Pimeloyl-ACP methyl ester carboxylesterase n=1 Tax=Hoeflea marina TaxID=274592 RepID=A0A317PL72_9HYPH|nr:alpha/beta fold hydrolase [Hoeflea marina]PWV98793.1 pimeloyl-ACP methyl ester carboxylesterase [Hoeflea marina]